MRIIIDFDDEEQTDFLEVMLTEHDLRKMLDFEYLEKTISSPFGTDKNLNILVRRTISNEKESS